MTKLVLHNDKGEATEVINPDLTYTAAEWDLVCAREQGPAKDHTWIFDQVNKVKSSPESYFALRGEWSNASIEWPFDTHRTTAELNAKGSDWLLRHRAMLTSYCRLRALGHHPQVAYIVTFAAKSEENAALIDRSFHGANFLEGLEAVQNECLNMNDAMNNTPAFKKFLAEVDGMLKTAHKPEDTRPLFELRGKLSLIIDRAAAKK